MKKISSTKLRIYSIAALSLLLLVILLCLSGCAETSTMVLAAVIPGVTGGKILSNEPATLANVDENSPSLLRNEIDIVL